MQRTIVIRRDYLHFIKKYRRYEKRHRNMSVHCSPAFRLFLFFIFFNFIIRQYKFHFQESVQSLILSYKPIIL